jgi:hypothetical protein
MGSSSEYRHFLLKAGAAAQGSGRRKTPLRESNESLALGLLSTGLGIAVLFKLAGAATKPAMLSSLSEIFLEILLVLMVGQALGIAGIRLAKRRRRALSPLSTLGTTLNAILLAPLYLVLIALFLIVVLPLGLLIWGLAFIVVTAGKPAKNERKLTRARAQAQVALVAGRRVLPAKDPLSQPESERSAAG